MTNQQTISSPGITSPVDATTKATALRTAQATAPKPHLRAIRSWFTMKHFILPIALIAVIVLFQLAIGGGGTGTSDTAESGSQPMVAGAMPANGTPAGIGTKVRDATFEFVVTGVERPGKTFPGKLGTTLTALGEFLIVRVDITNVGDEAQRVDCQCQYLINEKGQASEPSSAILYTADALAFVQLINPDTTVTGVPVVFDVAPETKVVSIELHGSASSPGAQVKLF